MYFEMTKELEGIIVGYGNMGAVHHHAAEVSGARIIGVVDSDPTRRPPGDVFYATEPAGLSHLRPDFVVVSSPTPAHVEHVDEVVRLFRDTSLQGILLEKPPVRTTHELEQIREIARTFGHICVGEVEHYNPKLARFMDNPDEPEHIRMTRQINLEYFLHGARPWFLDEGKSGGIVLDAMIHDLNLLVSKYGLPEGIREVEGEKQHYDIHDNVRTVLDYEIFDVEVVCSWTAHNNPKPIEVSMQVESQGQVQRFHCDDYIETHSNDTNPYVLQMRRFLASIETQTLPFPLEDYLGATDLALRIREQLHAT